MAVSYTHLDVYKRQGLKRCDGNAAVSRSPPSWPSGPVAEGVTRRVQGVRNWGSPRNALLSGATAYFDAMAEPGRTRLLLLEAPAVLGFESTGAIDRDNAESTLRVGLSDLLGKDVDAARLQALSLIHI